jgi:hypothetical protein
MKVKFISKKERELLKAELNTNPPPVSSHSANTAEKYQ